jgi:cation diffusion facilitator CzcD-associated flavoprotein CzcO
VTLTSQETSAAEPAARPELAQVDVLIIGAGFSGLCVARGLRRRGFSFRILERAGDVGGTWRDNTYPGCACDIPSPLYSFSFAQRAGWTRLFPRQPEILDYLRDFAARRRLLEHTRFGAEVTGARWDERSGTWAVTEADGTRHVARALVSAIGALAVPSVPKLPGLDTFAGPTMHSATWDHDLDLRGQRVAVIGTGASAIQFVPQIVERVAHLTLVQRTPPWVVPKPDVPFSDRRRLLRRFPPYRWYDRARMFWIHEARRKGFTDSAADSAVAGSDSAADSAADQSDSAAAGPATPEGSAEGVASMVLAERLARSQLRRQVPDPELRAALTPDYAIGCKRLLISSDYYPALSRPNVTVTTSGISAVRPDRIVTEDGTEHPVDVIIFATGFDTQHGLAAVPVVGRDGLDLERRWRDGLEAYLGTTVSGFPNYFVMMGPNSGLGHNSQIFMIEAQARYTVSALAGMRRRRIRSVEVRPEVERAYNTWVQGRLAGSVWQAGGCRSWYQHARTGRNTLLWPSSTIEFWRRTHRARLSDYRRDVAGSLGKT